MKFNEREKRWYNNQTELESPKTKTKTKLQKNVVSDRV